MAKGHTEAQGSPPYAPGIQKGGCGSYPFTQTLAYISEAAP